MPSYLDTWNLQEEEENSLYEEECVCVCVCVCACVCVCVCVCVCEREREREIEALNIYLKKKTEMCDLLPFPRCPERFGPSGVLGAGWPDQGLYHLPAGVQPQATHSPLPGLRARGVWWMLSSQARSATAWVGLSGAGLHQVWEEDQWCVTQRKVPLVVPVAVHVVVATDSAEPSRNTAKSVFVLWTELYAPSIGYSGHSMICCIFVCWWAVMLRAVPIAIAASVNPFTAPACKISRLKNARTHLQTVYFLVLSISSAVCFDENPFTC